jgi:hypothetical protein
MRTIATIAAVFVFLSLTGCYTEHKVETTHQLEIKPMHITIDINLKVDRALDDFFGDIDKQDTTLKKENK